MLDVEVGRTAFPSLSFRFALQEAQSALKDCRSLDALARLRSHELFSEALPLRPDEPTSTQLTCDGNVRFPKELIYRMSELPEARSPGAVLQS